MKLRNLLIVFLAVGLWLGGWMIMPVADALTNIQLEDVSYKPCPEELSDGIVSSGDMNPANCFLIVGTAKNTSGKPVVDADVFGRIYDANNNSVMENRGRVGTLLEVPPGESDFEIRISVSANQPTPLKLEQFKASGFASKVRPFYYD